MIRIVEVGPRDGLQNEKRIWTIDERIQLINLLSQCGFSEIEVGSFVSPKWVPQMAGTDEVFKGINRNPAIRYSVLVPNDKGMEAALNNDVRTISIFTAASEAFIFPHPKRQTLILNKIIIFLLFTFFFLSSCINFFCYAKVTELLQSRPDSNSLFFFSVF